MNSKSIHILKKSDHKKEVLIHVGHLGWYPPPIGGISIHLQRLKREFDRLGTDSVIFDVGSSQKKEKDVIPIPNYKTWILQQLFSSTYNRNIIHNHLLSWKQRALPLLLKLRRTKVIYTFHSLRDDITEINFFNRICAKLVLRYGDHFIAVAPHIRNQLISWGVEPEKISLIPAFIPPIVDSRDRQNVPTGILQFLSKHSPIVSANASRVGFFQGVDLYGMDLSIKFTHELKKKYPDIGFVFCLPSMDPNQYVENLKNQIVELDLTDNFSFVTDPVEFYLILEKSDLFVRPTNTDGDSISVREALWMRVPALCSDVVERPEGVELFKSRDLQDFVYKAKQMIDTQKKGALANNYQDMNILEKQNVIKLIAVYQSLYGSNRKPER